MEDELLHDYATQSATRLGMDVEVMRGVSKMPSNEGNLKRWVVMFVLHRRRFSYSAIGRYFGCHYTSVVYGVQKVSDAALEYKIRRRNAEMEGAA